MRQLGAQEAEDAEDDQAAGDEKSLVKFQRETALPEPAHEPDQPDGPGEKTSEHCDEVERDGGEIFEQACGAVTVQYADRTLQDVLAHADAPVVTTGLHKCGHAPK